MNKSGPLIDEIMAMLEEIEGRPGDATSHPQALASLRAALLAAGRGIPSGPHLSGDQAAALASGIHDPACTRHLNTCLRCIKAVLAVRDELLRDDTETVPGEFMKRMRSLLDGGAPDALKLAASSSIWSPGTIGCMLLDPAQGKGYLGLIEVRFTSGRSASRKVHVSENLKEVRSALERSCRIAAAYARRWLTPFNPLPVPARCVVTLEPSSLSVTAGMGKSLDLPVALAAIGAHFGWPSKGAAASGALRTDVTSTIDPAAGIRSKIAAAAQDHKFDRALIPAECLGETKGGSRGLDVMGARDLDEAVVSLFPVRRIYVRCGKIYAYPPSLHGLPCGWAGAALVDLPPSLDPVSLVSASRRVMKSVMDASRPGNLTQILIAGPVSLGVALGVAMSQRALGARGPVLFVQAPAASKCPGGVWCDVEAFPAVVLHSWKK